MSASWPTKKATELAAGDTIWVGGEVDNLDKNHQVETIEIGAYELITLGSFHPNILAIFKSANDEHVRMVLDGNADIPTQP